MGELLAAKLQSITPLLRRYLLAFVDDDGFESRGIGLCSGCLRFFHCISRIKNKIIIILFSTAFIEFYRVFFYLIAGFF